MTSVQSLSLPSSRWAAVVRWRNWRLPVKLAAITAVPVLLAISLGVLTVQNQTQRSALYERSDRFVVVGDRLLTLITALQGERDASSRLLAEPASVDPARLVPQRAAVDTAHLAVREAAAELIRPGESITSRLALAERGLAGLPQLRDRVGADLGLQPVAATGEYGAVIESLLDVDRALASDIADPELARSATALHDLTVTVDQLRLQSTLVSVGLTVGTMTAADLDTLRASAARAVDKVDDFRAAAGPAQLDDYQRTVAGGPVDGRKLLLARVLADPPGSPMPVRAVEWDAASGATIGLTADVAGRMVTALSEASAGLQARASNRAGAASVVLFVSLVVAAGVGAVITRQLLGSLGVLRRTALQVADRELPAAVAIIRDGGLPDTTVRPVQVQTTEDVGQLARAFDAVHLQALKLAADEAILRAGFGSVFVNLSRRSQGLVQRQLQLLERLERDEEDAEQLSTLFQLDHLATRMRRNNENLMVLSGSDHARRPAEPAPLVDLLRAAISEIEHYQRVELRPPPATEVVGHATGDLVRLVAELLDNATAFSPPDTAVTVAAHRSDNGSLVVNVLDQGLGMSDEEIAEANARLRDTGPIDLPASRRMGLYVVGRLAMRHGFGVRLHGGKDLQGVQATVTVPAGLVVVSLPSPPTVLSRPGVPTVRPPSPRPLSPQPLSGVSAGVAAPVAVGDVMFPSEEPDAAGSSADGWSLELPPELAAELAAAELADGLFPEATPEPFFEALPGALSASMPSESTADPTVEPIAEQVTGATAGEITDAGMSGGQLTSGADADPASGQPAAASASLSASLSASSEAVGAVAASGAELPAAASSSETMGADDSSGAPVPASVSSSETVGADASSAPGLSARGESSAGGLPVRRRPNGAARNSVQPGGVQVGVPAGVPGVVGGGSRGAGLPSRPVPSGGPGGHGRSASTGPQDEQTSWWDTGASPAPPPRPPLSDETTPIFDQMVSAWFQVPSGWPHTDHDLAEVLGTADVGTIDTGTIDTGTGRPRTVDATAAGAVTASAGHGNGVNGQPVNGHGSHSGHGSHGATDTPRPGHGGPNVNGLNGTRDATAVAAEPGRPSEPLVGWESAADSGWSAARAMSTAAPTTDYTPAGLPRRVPRQSLLPGSVVVPVDDPVTSVGRDAEYVRGRLSNLRAGIDRGRHGIDTPPTAATSGSERATT